VKEIESRTYFKQGNFEFNFSTNIGVGFSTFNSTTSSQNFYQYDSSYYEYTSEYSDRPFNLLFTASFGYCIFDGLAFEPELDINLITDAETSISLIGNLTYNFNIPRKSTYPFIKLGYGVSNYLSDEYYGYPAKSDGSSFDTKIINAGAGLKLVYSSGLAMKLEINFKNYSYSTSSTYSDQYSKHTTDVEGDMNVISISLGFSILL
jgi:hypothetical protein